MDIFEVDFCISPGLLLRGDTIIMAYAENINRFAVAPPVACCHTSVDYKIFNPYVFYKATLRVGHKAKPAVALLNNHVINQHVSDMAVNVPYRYGLRAGFKDAVCYNNILAGLCPVCYGCYGNAVVAAFNIAV